MLVQIFVSLCISLLALEANAKNIVCRDSKNTVEETECMSAEIKKAENKLADYMSAAKGKVAEDKSIELQLDAAQKAWLTYRDAQCGDVYRYWVHGTYRYRASAQCMLDLTQERTHDIWAAYLTYVDSTPPVKPEP